MDNKDFNPTPGMVEILEPNVRRVLCPNPSPMTFRGTNTYLLGTGDVAVIDPGPVDPAHQRAILSALDPSEQITHILITHSHLDHSPLAANLSAVTGAKIYAFGNSYSGRSELMERLATQGGTGGGEGVDANFNPDVLIGDQDVLKIGDLSAIAHWTPGHFGNHLSFAFENAVFTGDCVMGWASTMVSPPDGDLSAFMTSAAKLAKLDARIFYPGHGAPITDPVARANWLINHRKSREAEILNRLAKPNQSIPEITAAIYTDTPATLLPAAQRNVFAHLIDLFQQNIVTAQPNLSHRARFSKRPQA